MMSIHLESALEAEADFFLTDDDVFIRRVNRTAERYNAFAYQRANEICMHPTEFPPVRAVSHVWADVNMNTLTFRGSVLMRSIFSGIQALCHI